MVRLIPWIHEGNYPPHRMAVQFIRQLPKGSYLALEETVPDLQAAELLMQNAETVLKGMRIGEYHSSTLAFDHLAYYEVIFACHQRGIHIVPIENHKLKEQATPFNFLNPEREAYMVSNIEKTWKQLTRKKKPMLVVLTGAAHTHALYDALKRRGVPARVDFRLFDFQKRNMAQLVNLTRRSRRAKQSGREELHEEIEMRNQRAMENVSPQIYTEYWNPVIFARNLFTEIAAWNAKHPIKFTVKPAPFAVGKSTQKKGKKPASATKYSIAKKGRKLTKPELTKMRRGVSGLRRRLGR